MRSRAGTYLRAGISIGLIVWLVASMDFGAVKAELQQARPFWLIAAHILSPLTVFFGVWKWRLLLQARGLSFGTGQLTCYFLAGHFFSHFLPTNVGGDIVRISLVTRQAGRASWPVSASAVLVERITGLFGLFLVLPAAVALHYAWVASLNIVFPLIMLTTGFLLVTFLLFSNTGAFLLALVARLPLLALLMRLVQKLHDAILKFRGHTKVLLGCTAIAVLFYIVGAFQIWLLLLAFPHVEVVWTTQIVCLCTVSLLSMLPVSINGYGVQEATYAFFFTSLGFSYDEALVLALANRVLSLVIAVVGGAVFVATGLSRTDFQQPAAADDTK